MGKYTIVIEAVGAHHNGDPADADQLAGNLVDVLKAKGHSVTVATISPGPDTQDLLTVRLPLAPQPVAASAPAVAEAAPAAVATA